MADLRIPTVHRNGTSKDELVRQNREARRALYAAREKLAQAAPNGRDYYTQGSTALQAAMNEHTARERKLSEVIDELDAIAEALADQGE